MNGGIMIIATANILSNVPSWIPALKYRRFVSETTHVGHKNHWTFVITVEGTLETATQVTQLFANNIYVTVVPVIKAEGATLTIVYNLH